MLSWLFEFKFILYICLLEIKSYHCIIIMYKVFPQELFGCLENIFFISMTRLFWMCQVRKKYVWHICAAQFYFWTARYTAPLCTHISYAQTQPEMSHEEEAQALSPLSSPLENEITMLLCCPVYQLRPEATWDVTWKTSTPLVTIISPLRTK